MTGHFVTLIEVGVRLVRSNRGPISISVPDFRFCEICTSQLSSLFSLTVSCNFLLSWCQPLGYISMYSSIALFTLGFFRPQRQMSQPVGAHPFVRFVAGRCVCTRGLSYIRINNYQPRNNRTRDDVRFEFKSTQSSGMIVYLKGRYRDFLYVAYKDSRVFVVHIDLGTGNKAASRTGSLRPFADYILSSTIFGSFNTPLCNRPSGIYSLTGLANFPPGCPFLSGRCFGFFKHT